MADLLNIGTTGLFASKKALETTGHNLANANTEGYSRQRVNQTSNVPVVKSGLIMGTGTRIKSITRNHDPFAEKRLNESTSEHHFHKERLDQLQQVEGIFNEVDSEGLNQLLTKFYNSFRELANQPENETVRSIVRDNAELVINDFHRTTETLDRLSTNIDQKLITEVENINSSIKQIGRLNRKIAELEVVDGETGDLRDERDLAIRTLAQSFDISTYVDENNHYVVSAKNVGTLVSGAEVQTFKAGHVTETEASNNVAGSVEIYFEGRPSQAVTTLFSKGKIASFVKTRNEDITNAKSEINNIAYELAQTVNAVHRRGFVNRNIEILPNGEPVKFDKNGPTTGIDFFQISSDRRDVAHSINLSEDIKKDLSNMCTSLEPNKPGDNRLALGISKLQHEKILKNGTTTLEEYYLQVIAKVGVETGKAQLDSEQSEGILAQTNAIRERIAGVSIDEEAANLVKYQHAYDASAKVMKAADEMFKTVLSIKN